MLILILLFPFLGFLGGSLFGRLSGAGVAYTTTIFTFISFLLSANVLLEIIKIGNVYTLNLFQWIYVDSLELDWSFCIDSLTGIMLVIVTFISTLVHLYSTEYMEHDPHLPRFMSYLSLFTFFMLILITANNFLQMFVGWEGVGISSYLLINFWFTRIQANKSAIKAMLINRVGDFGLLLAIFALFFMFNTLNYDVIFTSVSSFLSFTFIIGNFQVVVIDLICMFLFIGAMGKSAQLGLHTWLPDAMEGPTPVSALIHAATMVTAGVFLISRCSYIFEFSPVVLNFVILIGSATAFFAATTGLFQNDMKKVIAYSTCSQLGYMIFACGLSSYEVGLFHLSNHAFFKALLFLGAGSVIHALADEQDMRKMGGLRKILPFSYSIMLIGSFALIGFPFLAGFYSKDVILEISYSTFTVCGHFSYFLGTLAAFATAFYSVRVLYLVFLSEPNGNKNIIFNAHEGTTRLTFPLFVLCFLSVFIGFLSKDVFIGFGTDFWGSALFINPVNYVLSDIEFLDLKFKILPLIITLFGASISFFIYNLVMDRYFIIKRTFIFITAYNFFNKKWYFDRIYNIALTQKTLNFSYTYSYKIMDRGLIESLGPFGIVNGTNIIISLLKEIQNGAFLRYLKYFSFAVFSLIICDNIYSRCDGYENAVSNGILIISVSAAVGGVYIIYSVLDYLFRTANTPIAVPVEEKTTEPIELTYFADLLKSEIKNQEITPKVLEEPKAFYFDTFQSYFIYINKVVNSFVGTGVDYIIGLWEGFSINLFFIYNLLPYHEKMQGILLFVLSAILTKYFFLVVKPLLEWILELILSFFENNFGSNLPIEKDTSLKDSSVGIKNTSVTAKTNSGNVNVDVSDTNSLTYSSSSSGSEVFKNLEDDS